MRCGAYLPAVAAFGAGAFFACCAWPAAGITSANNSAQPRFANRFGISRSPSLVTWIGVVAVLSIHQLFHKLDTLEIQELRFFSWQLVKRHADLPRARENLGVIHLRFVPGDAGARTSIPLRSCACDTSRVRRRWRVIFSHLVPRLSIATPST